jgi:eukaryotic-like serine/threonine-protein kinase
VSGSPRIAAALTGRYAVQRELGRGGMATVYLARDLRHHREVAIKVLSDEMAAGIGADRFLREIRLAASLHHPNILPLYDSGEADGQFYYVMPVAMQESLRDRLRRHGALPAQEAIRLACDIAAALDYAHRHGVVHRDIKPENILLHEDHALVTDFGIGRPPASADAVALTQVGAIIGTPAYMSPEQAAGADEVDGRSDLYSLGCVLYEMLAGVPPFTGPTAAAVIARRFTGPAPGLAAMDPDVSPAVQRVVATLMTMEPGRRIATGAEVIRLLRPAIAGRGGTTAAEPSGSSLAVLPFVNMSADPEQEYFSDGMTEELLNMLAQVPALRVAARTSSFAFKDRRDLPIPEIARQLHVGQLLSGSVRKAGDRVRITAQLIDGTSGFQIWSQGYDRRLGDIFALQDEIAHAIVQALQIRLTGDTPAARPPTASEEAYNYYLRGRHSFSRFTEGALYRAIELYDQALAADSGFARAAAGSSLAWQFLADDWVAPALAYPKARAAALRAVELDPDLAEGHILLASSLLFYDWDRAAAGRALARGLELNPGDALGHFVRGTYLLACGRPVEAVGALRHALLLDPLSMLAAYFLVLALRAAGMHADALRQARESVEIHEAMWALLGMQLLETGAAEEALVACRRAVAADPRWLWGTAAEAWTLAALGRMDEARRIAAQLEEEALTRPYINGHIVATVYASIGEKERAMAWLERALSDRSASLLVMRGTGGLDPLFGDPDFERFARKVEGGT